MATPEARPTEMAVLRLRFVKTVSSETSSGRYSAIRAVRSRWRAARRVPSGRPGSVRMTPAATAAGRGCPSTRPYPVTVRPGSIPKTNMCSVSLGGEGDGFGHCGASGAGHDPFHHLVIDVVVRVHGLNVVEVVEVVDEAEELLGVGLLHRHGGGGQLGDVGAFDGDPGRLDRLAHLGQFARGRDHLEHAVATVAYIF